MAAQQVAHNDISRVILRKRRSEHVTRRDLSQRADVPSVNQLVFRASALTAWKAMRSPGHPSAAIFRHLVLDSATRGSAQELLRPVLPSSKAIALRSSVRIWNKFPELRAASSLHTAKTLVKKLSEKRIPF